MMTGAARRRVAGCFAVLTLGCGAPDAPGELESHGGSAVEADDTTGWDVTLDSAVQCDNGPGERASVYYLARMNQVLSQSPELRAKIGSAKVETCDQARAFIEADNERADATEETWAEPTSIPELEPELVSKIHLGQTVSYDAAGYSASGVMSIRTSRGSCSAFLIGRWHLVTAAHCFSQGGRQDIQLRGFNASGVWGQIRATGDADDNIDVFAYIAPGYTGDGHRSADLALVTLQTNTVEHAHRLNASNERINLFRMYTGPTRVGTKLHIHGVGANAYNGNGFGVLRRGHDGARITVSDHQDGYFKADAHTARICEGDSGSPAIEWPTDATPPVVWGAAHGTRVFFWNEDACPHEHDDMYWTKLNNKSAWIEQTMRNNVNLGANFSCGRFTHAQTGETYMKCW